MCTLTKAELKKDCRWVQGLFLSVTEGEEEVVVPGQLPFRQKGSRKIITWRQRPRVKLCQIRQRHQGAITSLVSEGETLMRCSIAYHQGIVLFHSLNTWEQTWQQGSMSSISSPASKKIARSVYQIAVALGLWPVLLWRAAKWSIALATLHGRHILRTKVPGASVTVSVATALTSRHSILPAMRKDRHANHLLIFFPC